MFSNIREKHMKDSELDSNCVFNRKMYTCIEKCLAEKNKRA